jgi:hypothetical protein
VRLIARLLVLLGVCGGVAAAAPGLGTVKRARSEFEHGEYKRVIGTLEPQLRPRILINDPDDLKEAHYLLGVSYFYLAQRDLARDEFNSLLALEPTRSLDPATESPEVYDFFESLKSENKAKLEELQRLRQKEEELKRMPSKEVLIERTIREPSRWSNLVPFGYGQFRNGQSGKGVLVLVAESVFGGTSLSLFTYQAVTYGIPSKYPPATTDSTDRDRIRTLQWVQVLSGAAFLLTYGIATWDAFANQPLHETTKTTTRQLKPGASSLLITPLASPQVIGAAAMWRF